MKVEITWVGAPKGADVDNPQFTIKGTCDGTKFIGCVTVDLERREPDLELMTFNNKKKKHVPFPSAEMDERQFVSEFMDLLVETERYKQAEIEAANA